MKIKNIVKESIDNLSLINEIYKRVPFLKYFNRFDKDLDSVVMQYSKTENDFKIFSKEEIFTYNKFTLFSELTIYKHKINDNIFYNFILTNKFLGRKPESMDDLTYRILLIAMTGVSDNLSFRTEIMKKNNDKLSNQEINDLINKLNKCFYDLENYCEKINFELY